MRRLCKCGCDYPTSQVNGYVRGHTPKVAKKPDPEKVIKVIYTAGSYRVREFYRYACQACREGWFAGTLASPNSGGTPCVHGAGMWQVGQVGPRGGWLGIGPHYQSIAAAKIVCRALADAAEMPRTGA